MTNSYLQMAEAVLRRVGTPLNSKQILEKAYLDRLVPSHLFGRTQHKTLQARLSEDILEHRATSRFCRTAPGRFFLRDLAEAGGWRAIGAPPRWKELRRNFVLAVQSAALACLPLSEGFVGPDQIAALNSEMSFVPQRLIGDSTAIPVQSLLVIHDNQRFVSHKTGRFSARDGFATGPRTVGVTAQVLEADDHPLLDEDNGVTNSALRELVDTVGLPHHYIDEARYESRLRPKFGFVAHGPTGEPEALRVILAYQCPDDFDPMRSLLPHARWNWPEDVGDEQNEFDDFSRLLFASERLGLILRNS